MAYQGENWNFTIKGNTDIDLDGNDFKLLIYPCGTHDNNVVVITKSQCTKSEANVYIASVPYSTTKTLPIGIYNVEVLIISGGTSRSVFVKKNAFSNNLSASKEIE